MFTRRFGSDSEERVALIARLKATGLGYFIDRYGHLETTAQLRHLVEGGEAQITWYRSMGLVDEAEAANQ